MPRDSVNDSFCDAPNLPSATVLPDEPEREPMTDPLTFTGTAPPAHENAASSVPRPVASGNSLMPAIVAVTLPSVPSRTLVTITPSVTPLSHLKPPVSQPVNVVTLFLLVVGPVTSPFAVPPVQVILVPLLPSRKAAPSVPVMGTTLGAEP